MIILANFLSALASVLSVILTTLIILVTVRVVLSWVNADPYNPIVRFIIASTDPMLRLLGPLRHKLNSLGGGRIDWSPLVLVLILIFLQSFLVQVLADYAYSIRLAALRG
ncbi:MAG: YggT family protein [Deltaproteobacteria bacterium]|nr:YggT family protein [Deltaproteobacteria bacterium]